MKKDLAIDLASSERFAAWNRFWFTPANPTLLGLIRICCGLITFYTLLIYSFRLQEFMGEHAWLGLDTRLKEIHNSPRLTDGNLGLPPQFTPHNEEEHFYAVDFVRKWGQPPLPPYPRSKAAQRYVDMYMAEYGLDPRVNGLRPPENEREYGYLVQFTEDHRFPPPAYPDFDDPDERARIDQYIRDYGYDPRMAYAIGMPVWSLWFDVTDPAGMAVAHGIVVLVAFLFAIGFCTRITSVLTWMSCLWYIHRSPIVLFGVDTMQTILLLYLMIGPSGAALSVDRLIARWWSVNKPRVINRWRGLFGKPALAPEEIVPAAYSAAPEPSVGANVACRLIQIHLCIIYLVAGLAKLQGTAWWTGTAVWGTLANFEFAPMQFGIYLWTLKVIATVPWVRALFLTAAGFFTLAFEIAYAFLIWRDKTRWWLLGGAILLHGFIGLFMGLKTFSLMMLVMNMAFLREKEVIWFLRFFGVDVKPCPAGKAAPNQPAPTGAPHTALREATKAARG